jgi:zinc/manganese transport system permease protein
MNWSLLDLGILGPALIAGVLVLATHVPLGMQVLSRGIVFIDLAIAQIASFGVMAANLMGLSPSGVEVQLVAMGAALLGALLIGSLERMAGKYQEALIGVFFVLAASGSLLLLASDPHGGEHLKEVLTGQILWVSTAQLIQLAVVSALVLALWFGWARRQGRFAFYVLFAIAVTASVQVVGVYLVFSSLILPALAVQAWSLRARLPLAYILGGLGYAVGLGISAVFDLPSGAVIVWTLAFFALVLGVSGRFNGDSNPSSAP